MEKATVPHVDSPLCTDKQFNNMLDENYHNARSPLRNLGVGMVTQFPYDYMDLVCLGVVKKLLGLWIREPLEKNVPSWEYCNI